MQDARDEKIKELFSKIAAVAPAKDLWPSVEQKISRPKRAVFIAPIALATAAIALVIFLLPQKHKEKEKLSPKAEEYTYVCHDPFDADNPSGLRGLKGEYCNEESIKVRMRRYRSGAV
ncbi:MAG: hypothetical protein NTW04_05220 [Elusimicrobia bacterium]|nr:hypothetical protein [Elusimicrobiota bacterium]